MKTMWQRRWPALAFLLTLVLSAGAITPAAAATPEEMVAAAHALDAEFVAAFNSGDAQAMAALYWNDPQVISFPPGELAVRGHQAIADSTAATFAASPGGKLELTESHDMVAGDVVISWGLWRFTMALPDGTSIVEEGRFTDVKAERGGRWVYLLDHASVPSSPPAAPAPAPGG
jgi:uncharacterized protein (TIGR02246 family)